MSEKRLAECIAKWGPNWYTYPAEIPGKAHKMEITCNRHNEKFTQKVQVHTTGRQGCSKCRKEEAIINKTKPKIKLVDARPDLVAQINQEIDEKVLKDLTTTSSMNLKWKCAKDHNWTAPVSSRVGTERVAGNGCPQCSGRIAGNDNNIAVLYPHIVNEWSDKNTIPITEVLPNSHKKRWWKCLEGHKDFEMVVSKKITRGSKCPPCQHRAPCDENLFMNRYPDLRWEWDDAYNKPIEEVTYGSGYLAWWICEHGERFQARVCDRTNGGVKCPCAANSGYSKKAIAWLKSIMEKEKIYIVHADSEGEVKLPGLKKWVDGFHKESNTVYEFHGDYWHGNPKKFKAEDMNTMAHKTYGELYRDTLKREETIKDAGYNLVVMWESDYYTTDFGR